MKALFPSQTEPKISEASIADMPAPGPNAKEIAAFEWDPDSRRLAITFPSTGKDPVRAFIEYADLPKDGSSLEIQLDDAKIGPKILLTFVDVKIPKFGSPEEAEAWLEANS